MSEYDPAIAKEEYVATAQPVGQVYVQQPTYAQPTYATPTPVFAQPQNYGQQQHQHVHIPQQGAGHQIAYNARRPPPNRWADGICDWPKNLFPSCYCACCFFQGVWIVAQMAQKTGFASFRNMVTTYAVVFVIAFFLQLFVGASILLWLPLLVAFFQALFLRLHIVKRDNITECGNNPVIGEFCCGFWCWYCSVAQMARHVYGYTKVLDGDGDPERLDGYGAIQQV